MWWHVEKVDEICSSDLNKEIFIFTLAWNLEDFVVCERIVLEVV